MATKTPTSTELAATADVLREFMNQHTERLDFGNWDTLRETEAQLEVLAAYLEHPDPQAYLAEMISIAEDHVSFFIQAWEIE